MKTIETKKVADANEIISYINRLNYRNDTFQYRHTTREDNADIKYRHFDAIDKDGSVDGFAIIEIVVNGKLAGVRFFNLFRNITVDFLLGTFRPDYSDFNIVDADAAIDNTEEEITMTNENKIDDINNDTYDRIIAERQKMSRRELFLAAKKEVEYQLTDNGRKIWYVAYPQHDVIIRNQIAHATPVKQPAKVVDEFLRENYCGLTLKNFLAEQAAWRDEEINKALKQLEIDEQAEHISDKIQAEVKSYDDENVFDLLPAIDELNDVAEEPKTYKLGDNVPFHYDDDNVVGGQDGRKFIVKNSYFRLDVIGNKIFLNGYQVAEYSSPKRARLQAEFNQKRYIDSDSMLFFIHDFTDEELEKPFDFNIYRQSDAVIEICEDKQPIVFQPPQSNAPDTLQAVAATIADINNFAPEGWEISYDAEFKNYAITFNDETVNKLDTLALAKVLPPDKFFALFQNDTAQSFIREREEEIAALTEMRNYITDRKRLKEIDDLIIDNQRELFRAEMSF